MPASSQRDVAEQPHLAGLGVDLDHGDVGAERERRARRGEHRGQIERVALVGRRDRQLGPRLRDRRRAGHVERSRAVVEHDVGGVRLEQLGRHLPRLRHQVDRRLLHGGAALLQRPRAHRAAAVGHEVGVAADDLDESIGMPVSSWAIIDHAVAWPWPWGEVPV